MTWRNSTNWLSDKPIGEWYGVTTDKAGRVAELDLEDNELRGRIPPELGGLTGGFLQTPLGTGGTLRPRLVSLA